MKTKKVPNKPDGAETKESLRERARMAMCYAEIFRSRSRMPKHKMAAIPASKNPGDAPSAETQPQAPNQPSVPNAQSVGPDGALADPQTPVSRNGHERD